MSTVKKDPSLGLCIEQECKKKQDRLEFCNEHFDHFKFGTIRRDGTYPTDRDKKLTHYLRSLKK